MGDIHIPFILILAIITTIWIIYRIIIIKRHRLRDELVMIREFAINLFFLYFMVLIYVTVFKHGTLDISLNNYFKHRNMNLIPLKETIKMFRTSYSIALYNVIGNILLFIPLGFFISLLFKKCRSLKQILLYALFCSATIELIQYFTFSNISDIDDLLFNTIGAIIGLVIYSVFIKTISMLKPNITMQLLESIQDKERKNLIRILIRPVGIMLLCCMILAFSIFMQDTYSSKLTDEALAIEASYINVSQELVASKQYDNYNFLLKYNGEYLDLCQFEKAFLDRYIRRLSYQLHFKDSKVGYNVAFIGDYYKKKLTVIVFGKNNDSKRISITFNGKEYSEALQSDDFFIVAYPNYENLSDNTDIFNIYKNDSKKQSKDLIISFINKDGKTNVEMPLLH